MQKGKSTTLRLSDKSNKLIPRDVSEGLGKLPPQALDLEEAVLGALMLEKNALNTVIAILQPDHFYKDSHKEIYQSIIDLFQASEPIDMRTVVHQLRKSGKIELIGGAYVIAELTAKVSSASNIEFHARVVAEMAIKRRLISVGSELHTIAYEDHADAFELLDQAQSSLDEVSSAFLKKNIKSTKTIFQETFTQMMSARDNGGVIGIPSGYNALDRLTAGWQKTFLVIIAARPSMGKSVFVTNTMRNAAVDFKIPVAMFSLEMSESQVMQRLIAGETSIDMDKIIKGNLADNEVQIVIEKTNRLQSAPIFIDGTPSISTTELRAKARRLKAEHGIGLIIVDYLQLMQGDRSGNREQEIASISRALKGIAKELDVPVLALSQLSRSVETRGGDKRPNLSDLRESGSIEQDADVVGFLYRPEYYKIAVYEDGFSTQGVMEVIIAKARQGKCDTAKLNFIGKYQKVVDFNDTPFTPGPNFRPVERDSRNYKDYQVSRNEHAFGDDEVKPVPPNDDMPF
jgi:replicative DNA helicase